MYQVVLQINKIKEKTVIRVSDWIFQKILKLEEESYMKKLDWITF